MSSTSHLRSFQALELAVRTGSLKNAAQALSISPAAVGQRVKALEDYLGIDLLVRGRSGLKPTPALAAAMDKLSAAFRDLAVVADTLDMQRKQEIHIAAASDFAELWLAPRLARFRTSQPNILFCINGEGETPLRLGPVDCEITFASPSNHPNSDVLFRDYLVPISSPENTRRIAKHKKRERLEGFPLLHLDFYKDDPAALNWPSWIKANKFRRTEPTRGMRFQRVTAALEAVLADAGLTICGLALISALIDKRHISLPFPIGTGKWSEHAYQARFRPTALARPQVRRFRAWLLEECRATNGWLTRKTKSAAD
jgi:LysR family transcriptional regulator, glycine cleavage system transcriptional activator